MTGDATPSGAPALEPRSTAFVAMLGRRLQDLGVLDELQLRRAERAQKQSGERFDLVLVRLGLVPEADMATHLAGLLGLNAVGPSDLPVAPLLGDRLQRAFLETNAVLPIADDGRRVWLAMADPFRADTVDAIAFLLGRPVERCVMAAGDLQRAIEQLYSRDAKRADLSNAPAPAIEAASEQDLRRLEDLASDAPVIRLVHDMINRAVEAKASDIHLEPGDDALDVRFRIDGILHTVERLPPANRAAVTSRVKIMAGLDIAEHRLPQDGRINANVRGREIDLRVSTMPTRNGESVVLRILDRATVALDFHTLGFAAPVREAFIRLLDQPNGIVLVTGPTGSGKTTTLYTGIGRLNTRERKIFTVEDPIEYDLAGINQVQVQPRIGLTFAHSLRSILRQDPDVIMVGEIRDLETAQMAIQASLTGHLVLSTIHTNSAAATITRLLDMGVADYLLASTVTGILAQRLVRRLCPSCAAPAKSSPALTARLDELRRASGGAAAALPHDGLRAGVGCHACRNTGFSGRTSIGELLIVDDQMREHIIGRRPERALEDAAARSGMISLFQDGLAKAYAGETTLDEVLRVTRMG